MKLFRRVGAGLVVMAAIMTAGAWSSLAQNPAIKTQVLQGEDARAFLAAQDGRYEGGLTRAEALKITEDRMRKKGWKPAGETRLFVTRQYRELTLTRKAAQFLLPTLYADDIYFEENGNGYLAEWAWDDADHETWEGSVEICSYESTCGIGDLQVHTGSGDVVSVSGSANFRNAAEDWAQCASSFCLGGSWGCLFSGPAYWGCVGGACVSSTIGCGLYTWMRAHSVPIMQ